MTETIKEKAEPISTKAGNLAAASAIDFHVGKRIRDTRIMLNISQAQLADKLGITFQQVQKYEKGTNRVGAGRLKIIADVFDVDPSFFYLGLNSDDEQQEPNSSSNVKNTNEEYRDVIIKQRVLKALHNIENEDMRFKLVSILETMAQSINEQH